MSSKPLGYESLKAVLKHMEANKRFEISIRMPSIAAAERMVPLKIGRLRFRNEEVEVNGVTHSIDLLKSLKLNNDLDSIDCGQGSPYDIDKFGIDDISSGLVRTESDIQIIYGEVTTNEVEHVAKMEWDLQEWKDALKKLNDDEDCPEDEKERDVSYMESSIKNLECSLAPYYSQRNNLSLPYTPLIRYTKSRICTKKEVVQFPYKVKLHEARRNLNSSFFGNRSHPIRVELLQLSCWENVLNIRLPFGIKFLVETLEFDGEIGKTLDPVLPIIHSHSFPLSQVMFAGSTMIGLEHHLIKSAKVLLLDGQYCDSFNQLFTMKHMNMIIIHGYFLNATELQFMNAIRIWIREGAPIGKCIKIKYDDDIGSRVMSAIKRHLNGFVSGKRASIPAQNNSEVFVEVETGKTEISGFPYSGEAICSVGEYLSLPKDTTVWEVEPGCIVEVSIKPRGYHQSLLDS